MWVSVYICFEDWMIYCCQLDGKCTQFISFTQDMRLSLSFIKICSATVHTITSRIDVQQTGSCCSRCAVVMRSCLFFLCFFIHSIGFDVACSPALSIVWSYLISVSTLSIIITMLFCWNVMALLLPPLLLLVALHCKHLSFFINFYTYQTNRLRYIHLLI